jgi:hypothetical protein
MVCRFVAQPPPAASPGGKTTRAERDFDLRVSVGFTNLPKRQKVESDLFFRPVAVQLKSCFKPRWPGLRFLISL